MVSVHTYRINAGQLQHPRCSKHPYAVYACRRGTGKLHDSMCNMPAIHWSMPAWRSNPQHATAAACVLSAAAGELTVHAYAIKKCNTKQRRYGQCLISHNKQAGPSALACLSLKCLPTPLAGGQARDCTSCFASHSCCSSCTPCSCHKQQLELHSMQLPQPTADAAGGACTRQLARMHASMQLGMKKWAVQVPHQTPCTWPSAGSC
jgi:hypothetical protein